MLVITHHNCHIFVKSKKTLLSDWLTPSSIWIHEMPEHPKMTNYRPYILKSSYIWSAHKVNSKKQTQKVNTMMFTDPEASSFNVFHIIFRSIHIWKFRRNLILTDYISGTTSKVQVFPWCQSVLVKPSYLILLSNSTVTCKHEQQLLMVSSLQDYPKIGCQYYPKTFVNLPSIFLYAKFILRC